MEPWLAVILTSEHQSAKKDTKLPSRLGVYVFVLQGRTMLGQDCAESANFGSALCSAAETLCGFVRVS